MIKRRYSVVFLSLCLSVFLMGQTSQNEALTLDQCITLAVQQNPLVLSSLQQYNAALARVNQARAFPQPSIDWDSDLQPKLFDFKGTGEWYFGISQSVEFPGKRYLRGKIASKEASAFLQEIELLKIDIIFQVKQAFYVLLLSQEKLRYSQQNLELAQDYLKKAELKFDAGDVAKVEALRAKVEASKAANEVRIANNDVRLAKAMLNFLLARKKYAPLEIKGDLKRAPISLDVDNLIERALSFRPEMKGINIAIEREKLSKKQAYMSYLPDFELGVNKHRVLGKGEWWDFTLSFPIPLFFWQPKKGEIAEAEANIKSLEKESEHLGNAITLEVEEAYMTAVTANNQIRLFEDEILTQAEEVYNMFLFSYQEGEIGGIELIDARRTLIEARISYADALFNYGVALAALEKSIGQKLKGEGQ
ncbi:MAG: TolC family protein [Candidatus Aminicenantes bacterium]|nr:TolC family protein [Candidatus Aminicenantes bacterium]MDH5743554.1 TolC family protein [Candidatus Aminicenantes bacterium]